MHFSPPAPEDGEHNEDDDASGLALVQLVDQVPALRPGNHGLRAVPPVAPPQRGLDLVAVTNLPSRPPNLISAIPLCEGARLERSGVLLA